MSRIEFWPTSEGTDIVEIEDYVVRQVGVLWGAIDESLCPGICSACAAASQTCKRASVNHAAAHSRESSAA